MQKPKKILIIQTAFLGDVILTLPLAQAAQRNYPGCSVSFLAVPAAAGALENHPAITNVIVYDKKGGQRGIGHFIKIITAVRDQNFDIAFIPHRSVRSALVAGLAGIPIRIGFSTSAGKQFLTQVVKYHPDRHEIMRNLDLMQPLGIPLPESDLPVLHPGERDIAFAESLLPDQDTQTVGIAPGSVWKTKRWPKEHFSELVKLLLADGMRVVLLGGEQDAALCDEIASRYTAVVNAAGRASVLESAAVIRRCNVVVSNDSAPMHIAVGVATPVVAVFGATVPEFGFAPLGKKDVVVQTRGLPCRPCSIHGGDECPVKTFICMQSIPPAAVYEKIISIITGVRTYA